MVNTAGRGGHGLTKRFKVYSNDPKQPQSELIVAGKVNGYVEVKPNRISFMGPPSDPLVAEVRIVPQKGHPFTITETKVRKGENIRFDLTPLGKNAAEDGYLLTVTNLKKEPGDYVDYIEIKTDLKEKPIVGIPVRGRIHGEPAKGK